MPYSFQIRDRAPAWHSTLGNGRHTEMLGSSLPIPAARPAKGRSRVGDDPYHLAQDGSKTILRLRFTASDNQNFCGIYTCNNCF